MSIRTTLVCTALALTLCAGASIAKPAAPTPPAPTAPKVTEPAKPADPKAPDAATKPVAAATMVYAIISTTEGDIALELDAAKAPITVANFVSYTEKGHYDGTIFHRVISDFMIQGGGHIADMTEKPTDAPIKNEFTNGLSHKRGTIAMARKGGSPAMVDSATAQFFINVSDNDGSVKYNLDKPQSDGGGYAVFGKVIAGMDVVDKIRTAPTGNAPNPRDRNNPRLAIQNVPVKTVTINSVKKVSKADAEKLIKPAAAPVAPTAPAAPAPTTPAAPK
ncbi:MAG: peptidylprolyl isomerase [Phycisphaerales bacterium]|nr:peptidylprolyl isomerase [Phycisphaerales bacterium]